MMLKSVTMIKMSCNRLIVTTMTFVMLMTKMKMMMLRVWVGPRAALETVIGPHHFLICPLIATYFSSDAFSIISNVGLLDFNLFLNINNTF